MQQRNRIRPWIVLFVLIASAAGVRPASAVNLTTVTVASGLNRAVYVCSPPGDTTRLFIVERRGVIKILDLTTNTVLPTPFLDIDASVVNFAAAGGDERGLLGMAFHPEYESNGYFYVNYINTSASPGDTIIARYTRSAGDPNIADPASALILKTIDQPQQNHNGGCMQFGRDGKLYIGLGDGGNANDTGTGHNATMGNGQFKGTLLGKLLRLDVDIAAPYIPSDNPFVNEAGALGEIWAFGLRNPWRWSFDRLTDDLYIADVGQNIWEEVNYVPADTGAGRNFGWRCMEGLSCFTSPSGPECTCGGGNLTNPVVVYQHANNNISITGGYVYRGTRIPGEYGNYFYGDYVSGRVWSFAISGGVAVGNTQRFSPTVFPTLSSFGEDANGELYMVTGPQQNATTNGGAVLKIVPACDTAGDINADCAKNITDAAILVNALLGLPQPDPALSARSDVNHDGRIDGNDIQAWIAAP